MSTPLSCVTIRPRSTPTHSIIWLHGLGADGHDFEGIVGELQLTLAAHIRFVFPNAPIRPITVNGGMAMRAWYDILDWSLDSHADTAAINESAQLLHELIEQEKRLGVETENILLAGFSQGGVIALHAAMTYPEKLAGVLALSSYLPTLGQLMTERATANNGMAIFMGHGILDSMIPIELAKAAYDALQGLGYPVSWHDYLMEHSVCIEEIQHISNFINRVFQAKPQ